MLRTTALAMGTNGDGSLIGTRNGIDGETLVGAMALLLAFGASRLQSRQPSPRVLAGYIMESRIGFFIISHSQTKSVGIMWPMAPGCPDGSQSYPEVTLN